MIRMRTLQAAIKLLRELDPGCEYTLYALRQDIKRGRVPCVRAGRKILVNFDAMLSYLETPQELSGTEEQNKIRRIFV